MIDYNRVILIGRLTRDVETRTTPTGVTVGKMSLAVNERYKSNGEWKDKVVFIDVTAFGSSAAAAVKYVRKGSRVMIDGRLNFEKWKTKDGQNRSKLDVIAEKIVFLDSRIKTEPEEDLDDDVPF